MTPPIDTSPEAIAALQWSADQRIGMTLDVDDVVALAAEIARLTAERDALNEELREARMQAIADGVQFQMDMEDRAAERDEARAQVAELQDKLRFYGHFTRHPAAALAARDAAMRNEGRRQVKVKPLVWKEATGDDYRKGECVYARSIIYLPSISVTNSRNGWWLNTNSETYPTIEAAKAAAQADYDARILAALEPEGGE